MSACFGIMHAAQSHSMRESMDITFTPFLPFLPPAVLTHTQGSNTSLSLQAIYHYRLATLFPIDGTISYSSLAELTSLSELNLRRLLRHAMTFRIFREVLINDEWHVAHTAASAVLATDAPLDNWVGFCLEDLWPATGRTLEALELQKGSQEVVHTGFTLANGTFGVEPMFSTMGKDPARAKRFGSAMHSLTGGEGYEVSFFVDGYDWGKVGEKGDGRGTVVDLGGSHGFVSKQIAEKHKGLRFIVQDLQKTVASAPPMNGEVGKRVQFMAHNFNTEQPVKGADGEFSLLYVRKHMRELCGSSQGVACKHENSNYIAGTSANELNANMLHQYISTGGYYTTTPTNTPSTCSVN